ncbi:MAG: GIY-YIG nuclease family protein [Actinomycetota bacterium]
MIAEDQYGILDLPAKSVPLTSDERLLAGFAEIMEFVEEHQRAPEQSPTDIGEAKLAMRLKAIIGNSEQREALLEFDALGLLKVPEPPASLEEAFASDASGLLEAPSDDIFKIEHVPRTVTPPKEVAKRKPCEDFDVFEPLFIACQADLRSRRRQLRPFTNPKSIARGRFFVQSGIVLYVAEEGERSLDEGGRTNARLRIIFENGTESALLLQSLSANLYKDGRRITEPMSETLEAMGLDPETPMASVYVLRSLSDDPQVQQFECLHKIGCTKYTAEQRVKHAPEDTTFLNAPVEVIAEYLVPQGVEQKIEAMLHRIFAAVRLDIWFENTGRNVAEAREWFAAPLAAIDEAIDLIQSGAIVDYEYDTERQLMALRGAPHG